MISVKSLDNMSTEDSSKSLFNLSPRDSTGPHTNFSIQNYNTHYPKCENDNIMMGDICDSYENANFRSTLISKDADCDFYANNANNFNYDLINCERDIKTDDALYGASSFIWNFEDYFTI